MQLDFLYLCNQVHSHMKEYGIEVRDYGAVISDVALLASNQLDSSSAVKGTQAEVIKEIEINSTREDITGDDKDRGTRRNNDHIWVDPGSCCYALYSKLDADKVIMQPSPLALAKALKVQCFLASYYLTLEINLHDETSVNGTDTVRPHSPESIIGCMRSALEHFVTNEALSITNNTLISSSKCCPINLLKHQII